MTRAPALALAVLFAAHAGAQTSPEDQARGLLEDGRAYLKEGKVKQALDNFQTIVSGFSGTELVDDALLEIGLYHLAVAGDEARAREAFEQVTKRFPQSDGAAGAYYQLGRITLDRSSAPAELEDALAQFTRVQRLYPRSEWVPRAILASAQVQHKAGRLAEAADLARRVGLEHPTSDAAAPAQFELGQILALMGEPRQAMEEYQQVRNRHGESEWAVWALDRTTALFRLYGGARPSFTADPAFSVGAGDALEDVRGLAMASGRTVWIASAKVKGAIPFGSDGKMGRVVTAEDVRAVTVGPGGEVMVVAPKAVRIGPRDIRTFAIPGGKPGETEPLEKIQAAALLRSGVLLVADENKKRVFRFSPQGQLLGTFPDDRQRNVTRMAVDAEGAVAWYDRELKAIQILDEGGRVLRTIPQRAPAYEMKRPVDLAVDAFGHLYVADEETGVYVFSPQGQLMTSLTGAEVREPKALALDPSGAILVYDGKSERVVRFR